LSYKVYTVDNEKENRALRRKSKRVQNPQDPEMIILRQEMDRICNHPGVAGIAAPQLGKPVRIFALSGGIDTSGGVSNNKRRLPNLFFYNPRLIGYSSESTKSIEGCLSVPERGGYVDSPNEITIKWDCPSSFTCPAGVSGGKNHFHQYTFTGFHARAVRHEMDHLDGMIYIDHCEKVHTNQELEAMFEAAQAAEKVNPDDLMTVAEEATKSELEGMKKKRAPRKKKEPASTK